jgi:hypothetical protein
MSIRLTLIATTLAAVFVATTSTAATLASNGKARCSIVIAKDAAAPEQTAARELRDYLRQVTGAEFAIRTESQVKSSASQILVGPSNRLKKLAPDVNWTALGHDGIVIRTVGNKLLLAGGRPRGTLYAVYSFLEDTVGCRWWTGTESYVPTKRTLTTPALNTTYTPKLRYREAYYRDPIEQPIFAARLKLNGNFYKTTPDYGGHYKILGWCHTSNALLPPDKYLATHPEYYALVDGHRTPTQLCFTNDEMRKELTRAALDWIRKDPTAGIISISQNDCGGACQCPKCKAAEAEEGSPSGPLIRCVNAVAEEIEKQYPDMLVETLAYQYTRKPPLLVKPRHNVVVRLCTIECDFARPLDSDANKTFRDDMRKWSAIAPNLYVWDYVTDFASYIQPHPNMRVLAPNLRFFVDNNAIGVFEQGDCATSVGDFVRLRAWVLAHLEWDPSRDPKQLTSEFLKGYYGPAAPYMQSYLDLVHDSVEKNGMGLSCYNGNLSFMTLPVMTEATRLFDQAEKAVGSDPAIAKRIIRDRMPLDHVWLLKYDDLKRQAAAENVPFVGPADPRAASKEFIRMAREWKANNYSEGASFESYVPSLEARFAGPPPEPAEFAKMPKADVLEVHTDKMTLFDPPNWVKVVDDPKASEGKAAVMNGSHTQWAVQYQLTDEQAKRLQGRATLFKWKWYAVIRTEGDKVGAAFNCGIYDGPDHRELVRITAGLERGVDGEYHTYYLGTHFPRAGMYMWVAPLGNGDVVKGIYIDRFILVRDRG